MPMLAIRITSTTDITMDTGTITTITGTAEAIYSLLSP